MQITYFPIGLVHSPFTAAEGTPIQAASSGAVGTVEIYPEYAEGLQDIEGFSHLYLIYHFHLSIPKGLRLTPFMDKHPRGVFSMRGPSRPNPIGISVVTLLSVKDNLLEVGELDILDKTPLLDMKPYIPEFDVREDCSIGWLQTKNGELSGTFDDGRFIHRNSRP